MPSILALLLCVAPTASAKDLNGRVGLGFSQQFGGDGAMSAISLKYGLPTGKPTHNLGIEVDFGLELSPGAGTDLFGGGRFLWGAVAEDNMNLNLGFGVGYLQRNVIGVSEAGSTEPTPYGTVRLQPSLGAEFFLFGLENLGFVTELGVNLDLTGGQVSVLTVGGAPAVGMHYYF